MISFIDGQLKEIYDDKIVVEIGGLGFDIYLPNSNFSNLPAIGEKVKIYTYMNVREDDISLYGFLTKEDKNMFLKLLTVSGVGPKGALNIISNLGFSDLIKAIVNDDSKTIAQVQGIGKKTASKICIELGDKVRKLNFDGKIDIIKKNNEKNNNLDDVRNETVEALIKLGIKEQKAKEIVSKINLDEGLTTSDLLKIALRYNK